MKKRFHISRCCCGPTTPDPGVDRTTRMWAGKVANDGYCSTGGNFDATWFYVNNHIPGGSTNSSYFGSYTDQNDDVNFFQTSFPGVLIYNNFSYSSINSARLVGHIHPRLFDTFTGGFASDDPFAIVYNQNLPYQLNVSVYVVNYPNTVSPSWNGSSPVAYDPCDVPLMNDGVTPSSNSPWSPSSGMPRTLAGTFSVPVGATNADWNNTQPIVLDMDVTAAVQAAWTGAAATTEDESYIAFLMEFPITNPLANGNPKLLVETSGSDYLKLVIDGNFVSPPSP